MRCQFFYNLVTVTVTNKKSPPWKSKFSTKHKLFPFHPHSFYDFKFSVTSSASSWFVTNFIPFLVVEMLKTKKEKFPRILLLFGC